ncbi:MAG: BamA/TamA family outer membrane protein [Bacteroidales bacterium]|nr:BamA/TamA family outer membrane protein [Bacteroidales bacterium]
MSGKRFHIIIVLFVAIFMSSCSINRFIPEGKSLVKSNKITIEGKKTKISKSGLSNYITLKPYKSTFQTKIPNWIYYKSERRPKSTVWKWFNERFGRDPIYYDETEANNSSTQMMRYLDNVGYFHSKVTHTVKTRGKRSKITYHVYPTQPYKVNHIEYVINDSLIRSYIMRDSTKFDINEGDIYNAYTLDNVREIITERMKNSGYYYFNRDDIFFEVDSNYLDHSLAITMRLKDNKLSYKKYYIRDISIYPNFNVFRMNDKPTDSASLTVEAGLRKRKNVWDFYYFDTPQVKPQTFKQSIHIIEGLPYNLRSVTSTYRALGNYKLLRNINIEFDTVSSPHDSLNLLDCRITMQQSEKHSITLQGEGTNSGGDLGIKGSLSYSNKNIFHGAETFQLSLKGGFEAQKLLGTEAAESGKNVFNTWEFGLTASLHFPKFLGPFSSFTFARDYQPTTSLSLGVNTQTRYYYSRYISSASYTYDWKSNYRLGQNFSPFHLNSVKIANINPTFQAYLDSETSQRKKAQYTSHLIFGTRYSMVYNTQRINQTGSFFYIRTDFESSGNLLSLFNQTKLMTQSDDGHHELFGMRYAQYLRGSFDIRQHLNLGEDLWFVMRQFVGLGIPYGNSQDMPFERSFYGGGANGLRGWLYRTVGPGGYVPISDDIEKTGDLQLEFNAEYRFPLYNIVNGAIFIDAGNVWTYHPNESLPNSEFNFNTFYKQLAVDAGFGIRLDVSFLILRFDFAYAMRNPYPTNGSYWRFGQGNNLRMQAGIGYPF